MKKLLSIILLFTALCHQSLFTSTNEANPTNPTNVVVVQNQESSHFFRNLIICCAVFAAGYITSDIQNFDYIKINKHGQTTKISIFAFYLYKLGIKELQRFEGVSKIPCYAVDGVFKTPDSLVDLVIR